MEGRSRPPGYRFTPKEKELVEFYLLPRARGQPDLLPDVDIIEDDSAASTQPWKLFNRHNLKLEDEPSPYFYVHGSSDAKPSGRQDRLVDGGFKWKSQRRVPGVMEVGGEKIKWTKHILSLQLGDSGSLGWVMHEYVITEPHSAPVKICHIAFTGYGQKRKRIPDGYDECESEIESQRAPAAAAPPSDFDTRVTRCRKKQRNFHQETEQVTVAMEQRHKIDNLGESVAQHVRAAVGRTVTHAPPLASRSGMTRRFGKEEAEQVGDTPEQLNGEDCQGRSTSTPQCAAGRDFGMTTMAFHQGYSGAADASTRQYLSNEFITQMVEEMRKEGATIEFKKPTPTMEWQVGDIVVPPPPAGECSTAEHMFAYPRFCGVPDVRDMAAGMLSGSGWGDFC